MLYTRLLFLFAVLPLFTSAQLNIVNVSVPDSGNRVVFSCKENILQIDNLPRKAKVTASPGGFAPGIYPNQFNLRSLCGIRANADTIRVYGADGSLLYTKLFRIIQNPPDGSRFFPLDRNCIIGHFSNDTATGAALIAEPVLKMNNANLHFISCHLSIAITKDPEVYGPYHIGDTSLMNEILVKPLLERVATTGGFLFFDDVRCSNGRKEVYIKGFTFRVLPGH